MAGSVDDALAAVERTQARFTKLLRSGLDGRQRVKGLSWHGGKTLPTPAFLGAAVGEFVFHGCDLARTLKQPWPMERRDAVPVIDFFAAATPYVVDPVSSKGLNATFEVRFRGYETLTFVFDDGNLSVHEGKATRADVHLSVEPVAFLKVGHKRTGLTVPILTGRALAWGRRPSLAFRFPGLFQSP